MEECEICIKDYFKSFDSNKIRYGVFGRKDYSKIIVILQGRAEYLEKYRHIADHYIGKGFLALLMDWRGQGGSCRELEDSDKGHITDFSDYQKDFSYFLDHVSTFIRPGIEVYGLAHSMGGHNLLRYIIENKNSVFTKIIFSSPMLGIRTFPLPGRLARTVANIFVKFGFGNSYVINTGKYREIKFENNSLTSDREKFFENILFLRKNRGFALGGPTNSWVLNAFRSMDYIKKNISGIDTNVKTTLFYGTDDLVVEIDPIKKASQFMSEPCLELKNARHELMMEKPEILNFFLQKADMFFGIE